MPFSRRPPMASASFPQLSRTTSKVPHLLFALTSKRAQVLPARPQPQHNSSRHYASSNIPRRLPKAAPRASMFNEPPSSNTRSTNIYLWAVGIFGATIGLYLSYYYASYRASLRRAEQLHLEQNADVSNRWNDASRDYDEEIEFSEKAMFMGRKRRRLLGGDKVSGKVLEVSCGTGRNFGWYDFERRDNPIRELMFNDQSAVMLDVARGKWEELQRERKENPRKGKIFEGKVKGVVGDAGIKGVIKRPEGGFDTIVQTMGVCSMQDPVGFLQQMNHLVRQPGEGTNEQGDEGGRILLLEHGKGHYDWINRLLDRSAVMHADRYGCWYNKDIREVIKESGLKIGTVRRYHLGTTWEVVLRPNPELLRKENLPALKVAEIEGAGEDGSKKRNSWWAW